jgi:hypothetical protein
MVSRFLLLALTLVGCATPYKSFGINIKGYGGYEDEQIGDNKWMTTYHANRSNSLSQTRSFAYRRVREVCGKENFQILSQEADWDGATGYKAITVIYSCGGESH